MNICTKCLQLHLRSGIATYGNIRSAESLTGRLHRNRHQFLIMPATGEAQEYAGDEWQDSQTEPLPLHERLLDSSETAFWDEVSG